MKDKKAKKLINQVLIGLRSNEKCEVEYTGDWCDYDSEVSSRFKKLVMDIVEYRTNISISITETRIGISVDNLKSIKNTYYKSNNKVSDENYLEISIMKDRGFSIIHGYKMRSNYFDKNIYTELYDNISERLKQINANNFNNIWENIVKESGILRDNNLEQILDIEE